MYEAGDELVGFITTALFGGVQTRYAFDCNLAVVGNRDNAAWDDVMLPKIDAATISVERTSDGHTMTMWKVERMVMASMINSAIAKRNEFWSDYETDYRDDKPATDIVIFESIERIKERLPA